MPPKKDEFIDELKYFEGRNLLEDEEEAAADDGMHVNGFVKIDARGE